VGWSNALNVSTRAYGGGGCESFIKLLSILPLLDRIHSLGQQLSYFLEQKKVFLE